jgi:ribonuclease HI
MKSKKAFLYCDGASKGNPGHAGTGAVLIIDENKITLSEYIGIATNNIAEYKALLQGLYEARRQSVTNIEIFTDSELLAKQINGVYKVKSPNLQSLHREVGLLLKKFKRYIINHIPREQNTEADRLADLGANKGLSR